MQRGISTNRDVGSMADCLGQQHIGFVCRYYSFTTAQPQKRLTADEAKRIIGAGLRIVAVYEDGPTKAGYFSRSRGCSDAKHAYGYASAIGQPNGSAIYFAVDYDALQTDVEGAVAEYFEGVRDTLAELAAGAAKYDVGVYGSGRVCAHIKEALGLALYSWLAESHGWAGHAAYAAPDIRQEISSAPLCGLAGGTGGGYEDNFAGDKFGAFATVQPSGGLAPQPAAALAPPPADSSSEYAKGVAGLALEQYARYHQYGESASPLREQIRAYWEGIGFTFPGVQTAWSAVFVSWVMRMAGASPGDFKASTAHSRFVFWAIGNQENGAGKFRAHPIDDYAPRIGDIIHNNRGGQSISYAFAASHQAYESHSAIVVELGHDEGGRHAVTIGGNESDTVGKKRVALHPDGKVIQRATDPYICVIQNLL